MQVIFLSAFIGFCYAATVPTPIETIVTTDGPYDNYDQKTELETHVKNIITQTKENLDQISAIADVAHELYKSEVEFANISNQIKEPKPSEATLPASTTAKSGKAPGDIINEITKPPKVPIISDILEFLDTENRRIYATIQGLIKQIRNRLPGGQQN